MKTIFFYIAIFSFINAWANEIKTLTRVADCTATDTKSWIACKTLLESNSIKTIAVENNILCGVNDNCALTINQNSNIAIFSSNNSTIKRTGRFNRPIIELNAISGAEISNLNLEESINTPVQPTPGAQEINPDCKNINCAPPISINSSSDVVVDHLRITNGKIFNIALFNNSNVIISNSTITNAWWFGVWGQDNLKVLFSKNEFSHNRSNAILIDLNKSQDTQFIGNRFNGNHYASAFHVCGNGNEPCPGGQLDLVNNVKNVLIANNLFENGKMEGEFPEDKNHNWISGIEFETQSGNVENTTITNNTIINNSGSPFYVNAPNPNSQDSFSIDLTVSNNKFCNNRTSNYYASGSPWGMSIKFFNNDLICAPPASGVISANPNPCNIAGSSQTCTSQISWQTSNATSPCLFAKETKQLISCNTKGNIKFPGINAAGIIFELHQKNDINSLLITSLLVKGLAPIPSGKLQASVNPCKINPNTGSCSTAITWQASNAPNACIFLKETKQLFGCGTKGTQSASWINKSGYNFELHLSKDINSLLLDTLKIYGN